LNNKAKFVKKFVNSIDLIILIEKNFLLFKTGVMNSKTNKKLLILSVIFLVFWVAMAVATTVPSTNYLKVKPVLNRAIQTIQKIAFNEDAIRHTDKPDREVIMESNHGTVMIRGRVLASTTWVTNTLTPGSTGSSLFFWKDNYLAGTDSFIIAWVHDTISDGVSNSTIVWGTNNTLTKWDNIYIIWGSGNEIISWKNSFIVWGHDNILEWDDSYIIWWSNSKIYANHSFAAWSDILIDKDYAFAWKDRSDDVVLTPKKENTFTWFAQNWISIGYDKTNDTDPWTIDINWGFQVASEKKTCALNIAWAIQYIGWLYGCFCLCNGSTWESLTHSKNCRVSCSHLTWDVGDSWTYVWECRYKAGQNNWNNVKIWAIEPSQWCDNWMFKDFKTVYNADNSIKWWTWKCIWNVWEPDSCAADATVQEWICSTTSNAGKADYYTKCASWYPINIKNADKRWIVKWTCIGVNSSIKQECEWCEKNYVYHAATDVCKDETGKCNGDYNWKTLASLIQSKEICYRWNIANFKTGYTEDRRVAWWNWDCVWTWANGPSVAKCNANYKSEPWRCAFTTIQWVSKYDGYTWVAKTLSCNKWVPTWAVFYTWDHEVTWICSGVNYDRNAYCRWCDWDSSYNRHIGKCEAKRGCDYQTWMVHKEKVVKIGDDDYWAFEVRTCDRMITIMDKNLWAKERANSHWNNSNSFGYYYQWGNNHWFTPTEARQNSTDKRVAWSWAYDRKWYSWDKFIVQSVSEEGDTCSFATYWTDGCTVHEDIWWWTMDWFPHWFYNNQWWMDTLYKVHQNDIDDYIEDRLILSPWNQHIDLTNYMLNTWAIARRGPCPEWWHVPSLWEWGALVNDWCVNYPEECPTDQGKNKVGFGVWKFLDSITTSRYIDDRFLNAFWIPRAWRLIPVTDPIHQNMLVADGTEWFYWSSSTWDKQHIWYAWFYADSLYMRRTDWEMRWWVPIRCFKNPEIIDDTAHNLANQ